MRIKLNPDLIVTYFVDKHNCTVDKRTAWHIRDPRSLEVPYDHVPIDASYKTVCQYGYKHKSQNENDNIWRCKNGQWVQKSFCFKDNLVLGKQ